MQQQVTFIQNQQPRPNPQTVQLKLTPEDNEAINRLAQQLAATTSPEDRRKIQQNLQNMPADQLQNIKAKGVDPMAAYFRDRATKEWRRQQQGLNGNPNFTSNTQVNPAIQAQRQGQTPANISNAHGSRGMSGNGQPGGTPFLNNIDHFQGLQADGMRSQEQGQLVVPASIGQGINPEQFRLQQFLNSQQLANQNSGGRVSQQFIPAEAQIAQMQQGQGLQQAQQEKTNNAASIQAQSQARARAEAAARAQHQIGMQNQQGLQGMSQSGTPLSMLTRPVAANVQGPAQPQPQGTPQPRPPSRAPNPGQQSTPQIQQNFPQAGQQNNNQQPAPQAQMLSGIPQQLQILLSKHPQQQWREIIERFKQQAMRQSRFQAGAPPMSQTLSQPGQNAPTSNSQLLGDSALASVPMQHSASAGASVAQGPNQGMPTTQQMMFQQQQRLQADANRSHMPQMPNQQAPPSMTQQGNSLPDLPENSVAYMDQQPIPQQLYQNVVQKNNLPNQIKTWSHLKQYLGQNPNESLPMEKILAVQKLQFHQMLQLMHGRNRSMGDQNRPGPVQPGGAGLPPPPQIPPNMRDQRQQGLPQQNQMPMNVMGNLPPVTREEIQRVKMNNPQLAQMPEPQIRAYLTAYRQSEARKRLGFSQQPQNSQQFTFMPGQTPGQAPQVRPPRQQQHQAGMAPGTAPGQTSQTRPGMPGARAQATPAARPASQAVTTPQVAVTNQQSGKVMKRANDNEVMEVPNPNPPNNSGMQPQAGTGQPAPPFRVLAKEEISRLSPEQQKAYRERQNQYQQQMFLTHIARLTEEVRRTSPGLRPLVMDAPGRARIVKVLTAPGTRQMLARFNGFLYQYFLMTKNSDAIKQLLSYKMHLFPQYTPTSIKAGTWEAADQFSIGADYAETAVKDLLARFNHVMSRVGPQQPAASVATPSDATGSHPLSADNLKKHQDMQAAQRAKRPAQEVPPAPTASRPPFTFTDTSPRGQGTPRYAPAGIKQGLQQEDLKLPSKRQKKTHQENVVSTPIGGQATPAVSPQMAKGKKPDDLPFKCAVAGCEFQKKGFAMKNDLDNHSNTAHKPVEEHIADPLAFFLESMRDGMGLDENGEPKAKPKTEMLKAPEMQKTFSKTAGPGSKPSTPAPSAAAMGRGVSQASGRKDASPNPSQLAGAKGRPDSEHVGATVKDHVWNTSNVSLSDLQNTFGDLVSGGPRIPLNHHDPLGQNDDIGEFMDEFMESEAWTKMQKTAANVDNASSKATQSPAQHSDRGRASSDISKGDDVFIKIGTEDTELAESWALPELRLEPESGAEGADETEEWLNMDFADASTDDIDNAADMDFEWKEVDWDKLLAEQDKAGAVPGKK